MNEYKAEIEALSEKIDELNKKLEQMGKLLKFAVDRQYYFNSFMNPELEKLQMIPDGGILLCGNYGNPNVGDEWMLDTILGYIKRHTSKRVTIMLESNRLFDPSKYLKYDVDYIHYPKTVYDYDIIEKKFDTLIFGGGAIIEDGIYWEIYDYGINICRTVVDLPLRFINHKKKVLLIGLSTSATLSNQEYKNKLQYIIDKATYFSLRDSNSIQTLKEAGIRTERIHLTDDIVYANKILQKELMIMEKRDVDSDILRVGVVYIVAEETKSQFKILIRKIKEEAAELGKKCEITLLPFYDDWHVDYRFYSEIVSEEDSVRVLKFDSDIQTIINVFKEQDIMVCARYHAILLALCMKIPCVTLFYDTHQHYANKIKYLVEQFGYRLEDCIPISRLEEMEGKILQKAFDNSESYVANKIIQRAEMNLNELFEMGL